MGAELSRTLMIAAAAALLLSSLSACSSGSTREHVYFVATERCQSYFRDEIEGGLGAAEDVVELDQFLRAVDGNARGEFAILLRRSAEESGLALGVYKNVTQLSSAQKLSAYESISKNIELINQCRELEAYVSTYLLADQLRLAILRRRIPLTSSTFDVDNENQDEVAKALLAALVASNSNKRDGG